MSTKLSRCCVSGHLHKGTAQGKEETFAGLKAYVTGNNKSKTIMAITDIFGYQLNNVKLLADEYAKTGGFRVVVPDFFDNDSVDVKYMKALTPLNSDPVTSEDEQKASMGAAFGIVGPWLERQKDDVVRPRINSVVKELKADSERLGVIGFCWGARQALLLGDANSSIDAIVANHPSFAEFPSAFQDLIKPTLVQVGENDSVRTMFPNDQVKTVKDEIFTKKAGSELIVYLGATHGWTVRSDQNNEEEVRLKDKAAEAAMEFFQANLA